MVNAHAWAAAATRRPQLGFSSIARYPIRLTAHASSLSAIHKGIQRSEKAQYGNERNNDPFANASHRPRQEFVGTLESSGTEALRQRQKELEKLRREKAARNSTGEPQTRRKRFYDSDTSFGKDSLVYQVKQASRQRDVFATSSRSGGRPRPMQTDGYRSRESRDFGEDKSAWSPRTDERRFQDSKFPRDEQRSRGPRSDDRRDREPRFQRNEDRSQFRRSDERPDRDAFRQDRNGSRFSRGDVLPQRESRYSRDGGRSNTLSRENRDNGHGEESAEFQDADSMAALRRKGMMPMTVKYTTAASQFLYGRSVVKAALAQNRRKLYNLYVHAGEDRKDSKDHIELTALAKAQGVPITNITKDKQRLMDKMSMGRPHNGFVLEASPLPQPPVTALGKLEQTPSRLGFHVEIGHQTKEDEAINGKETFIARASNVTPKPFVLLIHEILDPGNLGGLLRTASYLGVDAVGITNRTSSGLTPVVLKSAAGAVEEVAIFTVDSPTEFLENSKRAGWKVYAAVAPPDPKLARMHKDKFVSTDVIEQMRPLDHDPCVLVLGNEGYGLPKPIKVAADHEISVPRFVGSSSVDSLNVSVAAGLLCHSFVKEKPKPFRAAEKVEVAKVQKEPSERKADEQVF